MMKLYRYNAIRREDRKYNTCEEEKNPLGLRFYARNMAYAERYRYVYTPDGEVDYECSLEVTDVSDDVKLFDMCAGYESLAVYRDLLATTEQQMIADMQRAIERATRVKDKKHFQKIIDAVELGEEKKSFDQHLKACEFQTLSDFSAQITLVEELKSLGFEGYFTANEVCLF